MRSFEDWLTYIESLHCEEIALGLERIRSVAFHAGLLHFDCPIVLIGGTNGKGSTVSTLSTLLTANNLRVGTYFSPHLIQFNERIVINGECIQDEQLCQIFSKIEQYRLSDPQPCALTFFEFTTLAALQFFKDSGCDIILLEVGLGGRLDAVNIVEPSLSIITTLGLDHMDRLGDTLEKIAIEKAGIVRQDKPVLVGQQACYPALLNEIKRQGAILIQEGESFGWQTDGTWHYQGDKVSVPQHNIPASSLSLAFAAFKLLACEFPKLKIGSLTNLSFLLKRAALPGRFQKYFNKIETIFDVAHNPLGAQWLNDKLSEKNQKNIAVWSSFKDKDIMGIVKAIKQTIAIWVIAPLHHVRAASIEDLKQALKAQGIDSEFIFCELTIAGAYKKAYSLADIEDKIIVFGSCSTVSEVMLSLEANI